MKKITFLAVGDIVIDAFIELADARVNCDINNDNCTISMRFGDKIPYKNVEVVKAVGNSPNASVSASRLGLPSALVSNVGDDENGHECVKVLQGEGVRTDLIKIEKELPTNYHYVLSYEAERTILIKHADFTYDFDEIMKGSDAPEWIYFSSVAENSLPYHHQIAKYVKKRYQTSLPAGNISNQPRT